MTKHPNIIQDSELAESEILISNGHSIFLRKDKIIQLELSDGFYFELADSMSILENISKLSVANKYPMLVIYADDNLFSHETRASVAAHTLTKADALVGKSMALKIIGNFYLKINKPMRPTRMFNDVISANQWLKTFA